MDSSQGKCNFCGADNSYERATCHECGTRLPWADELEAARREPAAPDIPATGTSPADIPDVKISVPAQWLPPEADSRSSPPPPYQPHRPNRPPVVFVGGPFSRHCCCGCLFLVMLFTFLPLSCVMSSGGIGPGGTVVYKTQRRVPAAPGWNR